MQSTNTVEFVRQGERDVAIWNGKQPVLNPLVPRFSLITLAQWTMAVSTRKVAVFHRPAVWTSQSVTAQSRRTAHPDSTDQFDRTKVWLIAFNVRFPVFSEQLTYPSSRSAAGRSRSSRPLSGWSTFCS
jgi:hypothetical protein